MADPLSMTGSIIAIVHISAALTSIGYGYISGVVRASDDIRKLMDELRSLDTVLTEMEKFIVSNPQSATILQQLDANGGPLRICLDDLKKLQRKIEPKGGFRGVWNNLKWPLKEKETIQYISMVERHKAMFVLALSVDHISLSKAIEEYVRNTDLVVQGIQTNVQDTNNTVQGIKADITDTSIAVQEIQTDIHATNITVQGINTDLHDTNVAMQGIQRNSLSMGFLMQEIKMDGQGTSFGLHEIKAQSTAWKQEEDIRRDGEKRKKLIDWIYPGPFDEKHTDISYRRREGTGNWLLRTPEMSDWIDCNSRLLWGYGIPGAGKTFLSSMVINHLKDRAQTKNYGVAYIYFEYHERSQQKPVDVLGSLIKQLANQITHLPKDIEELHNRLGVTKEKPTLQHLQTILLATVKSFSQTFLVFDALDECDQKTQRTDILSLIHHLKGNGINIFVAGRQYPEDIQLSFHGSTRIELSAKKEDIEIYIHQKIDENPRASRLVGQGEFRGRIISDLTDSANGMFLLVHFHIEFLCQQTTTRQILTELERLKTFSTEERPLDSTYDRAMKTVYRQPSNCVKLAKNIFSWLVKARRTLTVEEIRQAVAVEPNRYKLDELDLLDKATLLDVCAGLVTIDENSNIRLAHYTVQQYLLENSIIPDEADFNIVTACVTFLTFDVFTHGAYTSDASFKARKESYPFLRYAANSDNLSFHLKTCDEILSKDLILKFLKNPGSISTFTQAGYAWDLDQRDYDSYPKDSLPLHIVSGLGHSNIVQLLLDGYKISAPDSARRPSCPSGDVGVSIQDSYGRTALYLAAANGHQSVVGLLLQNGADSSVQTKSGYTALHRAAYAGHQAVVELLLQNGADSSVQDNGGFTTLHQAAYAGHQAVVELLLQNGADSSVQAINGSTALHLAAMAGHQAVVELLLQNGADSSVQDNGGFTALHLAAMAGHQAVVELLLQGGADSSVQAINGSTALHRAAYTGHQAVVELLLQNGADSSVQTKSGSTALHQAAMAGHQAVVELLLQNGADSSVQTKRGSTALHLAAVAGNQAVVELLLRNGGANDSSVPNTSEGTALLGAGLKNLKMQVCAASGLDQPSRGLPQITANQRQYHKKPFLGSSGLPRVQLKVAQEDRNAADLLGTALAQQHALLKRKHLGWGDRYERIQSPAEIFSTL